MVMVNKLMLVVIFMMVTGLIIRNMDRDSLIWLTEQFIKVNSNQI